MARARNAVKSARGPRSRNAQGRVYKFTRYGNPQLLSRATADGGYARGFNLSDVAAYSEFAALFDEYRITSVEVLFIMTGVTTPGGTCPIMYSYPDYDDAVPPATQLIALQVDTMKITTFSASSPTMRIRIKPKFAIATPTGTACGDGWVDMADPGLVWYGIKSWIANYNTNVYPGTFLQAVVKYDLEFRSVR